MPMPPGVILRFRFSNKYLTILSPILFVLTSHLICACYVSSNSIVLDLVYIAHASLSNY